MHTLVDYIARDAARRSSLFREAMLLLAASGLVALAARLQAPAWPVPFTMQPFAVLLVGSALGARRGALAMVAYLLEGAAGLPVFALGGAGPAYFAGPTGGYLLAFPIAAMLVGGLAERGWDRRAPATLAAMAMGDAVILACGWAWLALWTGPRTAYATGVAPFLVGDVLKILLAAVALPGAWHVVRTLDRGRRPG